METHEYKPKDPQDFDRQVGTAIATVRKAKGMSQTALGQACGVSFQQVQKYEQGKNRIGASRLQAIAEHLGVPMAALLAPPDATDSAGVSVQLLDSPQAADLLQAFTTIRSPELRQQVVDLVRATIRALEPRQVAP